MNKRKMLLIGCGKAGNKLVNEMLRQDNRYTGLFVNSSYNDMAGLSNFREDKAFLFTGVNGSGRNREKAKEYVVDQLDSLVDVITSYPLQDVITVFTSTDGGTGSGVTPMLIQALKFSYGQKKLERKINLVAVLPDYGIEDKVAYDNTLHFWNDIMEIKDSCLDNIIFVDNSKGRNYAEINSKVVTALDNSYSMNGTSDVGDIDDNDANTFNTGKGFGLVLTLEEGYSNDKQAIDMAIKNSVFVLPDSNTDYTCRYLGISLKEDFETKDKSYNTAKIRNCFENVSGTVYQTYNNYHNTVVLSGLKPPKDTINLIKVQLDDMNKRQESIVDDSDLFIDLGEKKGKNANKPEEKASKPTFTKNDIGDITNTLRKMFK